MSLDLQVATGRYGARSHSHGRTMTSAAVQRITFLVFEGAAKSVPDVLAEIEQLRQDLNIKGWQGDGAMTTAAESPDRPSGHPPVGEIPRIIEAQHCFLMRRL